MTRRAVRLAFLTVAPLVLALAVLKFGFLSAYSYALEAHERAEYSVALPIVYGNALFQEPAACALLGAMYLLGHGVTRNGEKAEYWLLKAANTDFVGAMSLLGTMYATGQGVLQDSGKARDWLMKAAAKGDKGAAQLLRNIGQAQPM